MLPKNNRLPLTTKSRFQGTKHNTRFYVAIFQTNTLGYYRAAAIINKQVSPKATLRNFTKRRFFHLLQQVFDPSLSLDILFILKPNILEATPDQLTHSLTKLHLTLNQP